MNQYYMSLLGGIFIGLASSLFLFFTGRVAGISGIVGALFNTKTSDRLWRFIFLMGLIYGSYVLIHNNRSLHFSEINTPASILLIGSLLVGFGTRLGNGCTSGHGVCGISRGSKRSLVATVVFILTGMITVFVAKLF